jgi:hypothetical protein
MTNDAVSTLQRIVFQKAIAVAGSAEILARTVDVEARQIGLWAAGQETAPTSVFNKVAGLVSRSSGRSLEDWNRLIQD